MDFGNAALLAAGTYGIAELIKAILPGNLSSNRKVVVLVVLVSAFAAVFLIGATAWAKTQLLGEQSLDQMSVADKVLTALVLAGVAAFGNRGIEAVRNIGENQPVKLPPTSTGASPPGPGPTVYEPTHPSAEFTAEALAEAEGLKEEPNA